MERYRFLALLLPLMAIGAAAQETTSLETESAMLMGYATSYYVPVVGGILLLFLLFLLLNRATGRRYSSVEFLASAFGIILGIILVLTGLSFLAAASVLAWAS